MERGPPHLNVYLVETVTGLLDGFAKAMLKFGPTTERSLRPRAAGRKLRLRPLGVVEHETSSRGRRVAFVAAL
jgi:hypothetical protein